VVREEVERKEMAIQEGKVRKRMRKRGWGSVGECRVRRRGSGEELTEERNGRGGEMGAGEELVGKVLGIEDAKGRSLR
jgi:hypothetical protein